MNPSLSLPPEPARRARPSAPAPRPPRACRPVRAGEIGGAERRALVAVVLLAHGAAAWALLQLDPVRAAAREVAPMVVDLVAPPPQEPRELPPPAAAPRPPARVPAPRVPQLAAPSLPTAAPEAIAPTPRPPDPPLAPIPLSTAPAPVASPAPAPVSSPDAPPAPPPAAPPAAPQRRLVAATAVQYLQLPPVEVPRLSRRAGESGTVWLRVVVDVRGQPLQVSLQRSSGHARLDEQALWAMRQARFKPHTENGQPVELEVIAPIEYTLE